MFLCNVSDRNKGGAAPAAHGGARAPHAGAAPHAPPPLAWSVLRTHTRHPHTTLDSLTHSSLTTRTSTFNTNITYVNPFSRQATFLPGSIRSSSVVIFSRKDILRII